MILYYVVLVGSQYAVFEMTAGQMNRRMKAEPELVKALDKMPFKTRAEAERRRDQLNDDLKENCV